MREEVEQIMEEKRKKNNFMIMISFLVFILSLVFLVTMLSSGKMEKQGERRELVNPEINQLDYTWTIFIGFTSSTCPHCIEAMPKIDKIQAKYPEMKMVINVLNNKPFKGMNYVAQVTDKDKVKFYEDFTGERCDFVPSYVIKKWKNIIDKKCWGMISEDELLEKMWIEKKKADKTILTSED